LAADLIMSLAAPRRGDTRGPAALETLEQALLTGSTLADEGALARIPAGLLASAFNALAPAAADAPPPAPGRAPPKTHHVVMLPKEPVPAHLRGLSRRGAATSGRGAQAGGVGSTWGGDVRRVLLSWIIERCRSGDGPTLEQVGGEAFFRSGLRDADPLLAHAAASFLLQGMVGGREEEYHRVLRQVLSRAQQSNDERLLLNSFLQVCTIVDVTQDYPPPPG